MIEVGYSPVAELYFNVGAEEELARLAVDVGRGQLYEWVNGILDAIEDDHTVGELRRQRFADPPLWAVKVHGSLEILVSRRVEFQKPVT